MGLTHLQLQSPHLLLVAAGTEGLGFQCTPVSEFDSSSITAPPKVGTAAASSSGPPPRQGVHSNSLTTATAASPTNSSSGSRTHTRPDKLPDSPSSSP